MKNYLIWILCAVTLPITGKAEDLREILELARQNDPVYRAAEAEYMAAREASPQAWAAVYPQLNASVSRTKTNQNVKSSSGLISTGESDFDTDSYSITLTQTIYRRDQFIAIDQAEAEVARAEARFQSAKQELILRVSTQYFAVLAAEDNLHYAQAEKTAIEQQLNQAKQRFEVGMTAITNVHEAQARYDQSVAQEIVARNNLAISREQLRELTGQMPMQLSRLRDDTPLISPEPNDIDAWVKTAMEQNYDLIAAEKNMENARNEVKRLSSGHYPTLDLIAEHSNTDVGGGSFGQRETEENSLTLQLNVPLFSGGRVSSQVRQAEYSYQQAKELYIQQRRATERQARSTYLSVIANISQVKALKQALASSETALEATKAGYSVGTRTAVDVLDSQRELYLALSNYSRSRYDYLLETLRLKQAAGILQDEDITKINSWLE